MVAHQDRLARFGFELLEYLSRTYNCELVVMSNGSLGPEREMVQDMLAIVDFFSARLYGLHNYRKALEKALTHATGTQDTAQPDA